MTVSVSLPDSETVTYTSRREWLAERTRGIGGSDVPAILGMSRWSSPLDVWREKTGRSTGKQRTWAMARGTALEPLLVEWFKQETGIDVDPLPMQRNLSRPWMLGSLDGLAADGGVLECKTTTWRMASDWDDDQIADHAELQSQWYMAVTGARHAHVIAAIGDDDPVIRRAARDDALIGQMIPACERFWTVNVLGDREPDAVAIDLPALNDRPADESSVYFGGDVLSELINDYRFHRAAEKYARESKSAAQARILQLIGDAGRVVIDGAIAATRKTFDKAGFVVQPRTESRLTVPEHRKPYKET